MTVTLCDRCGRVTDDGPAFMEACKKADGLYQSGGTWFGPTMILCPKCKAEFDNFKKYYRVGLSQSTKFNTDLANENTVDTNPKPDVGDIGGIHPLSE